MMGLIVIVPKERLRGSHWYRGFWWRYLIQKRKILRLKPGFYAVDIAGDFLLGPYKTEDETMGQIALMLSQRTGGCDAERVLH